MDKKEYDRLYYIRNKDRTLESKKESRKEWLKNNPDYCKKYYEDRKEHLKEYGKKWYQENIERCKENVKKYYEENKKRIAEYQVRWAKTERGKTVKQRADAKRQAIEKNIINTLTSDEWIDILKKYNFRCAYCGCKFTLFNRESRDHIIPLSKGGNNTKENVVPACKSCNSRKNNKIINFKEVVFNGVY